MIIKGRDLIFYIEIAGQNIPLCHARTCTINTTATTLPSTTLNSGRGETNEYAGKYAYTIKGEGLNDAFDVANNFTLQSLQTSFTKVNWTFTDNSDVQWYGTALITSTTFDGAFDAVSSFQNELLGDGEYTFQTGHIVPVPPVGSSVLIQDQFGNAIATVAAPGTYTVTKFDTIDLHFWNTSTNLPITPQITITETV